MSQNISTYISEISEKYKTGRAGEHAYRPSFEKLIKSLDQKLGVINDPKRTEYGAPDFIFVRGDLIAGYAETKDINADLDKIEKTEQVERYLGYSNLILTNYLEFRFFRNGERYGEIIVIGKIINGVIHIQEQSLSLLENAIADFFAAKPEAIKSGARLAKIMGGKARRIRDNVKQFLATESDKNAELVRVYETVKKLLVHDLTPDAFADMYAQTLVYGLFVARYHEEAPESFSRQEARDLIPPSNPFLRHFFDHIVGPNFDKRLSYIVNELCEIFRLADVQELMRQYFQTDLFGNEQVEPDPVIHFYEDFLREYDPELRKKMGAYYTPLPIVRFIIRSVDNLLEKEFGLSGGLANTMKIETIHKVQILDPACGTGTFLNETIRAIYSRFENQKGRWPTYIHHDLLPRLHGFELMMAPYTIAHLKLSMTLKETGFKYFNDTRLGIYLTNSLEESVTQNNLFSAFGFAESIAEEAKEATKIKNKKPIMVVFGNPPYSVSSSNKGEWILDLINVYKRGLDERNKQPLSDDYIKFIRLAEHFIEKNGSGIVAMITNNSFLDGRIHRQMRKHLLETFDDVYIIDLHGSSKKKEKTIKGGKDENVFSIQQGVAISIFVRREKNQKHLGRVHHAELYGKREYKFSALNENNLSTIKWINLEYSEPYYFFVPKDFSGEKEYKGGFKIDDLFSISTSGIKTHNDDTLVSFDPFEDNDQDYLYRPFDTRSIDYDLHKVIRHRFNVMKHMLKDNISLLTSKQLSTFDFQHVFVATSLSDICATSLQTKESTYVFPLYIYSEDGSKTPNLKKKIVDGIEKIAGKVSPEDIFYYIYAILYSTKYREKYKEFLRIDFPYVPYPKNKEIFWKLVALGRELRNLHLLESPKVSKFITTYLVDGTNIIEKVEYKDGEVFINNDQYFGNVPEIAWSFWIGGYQPAQKWLKDRKGRRLINEDIEHYQKVIVALTETDRIMKKIDKLYPEIEKNLMKMNI
jgi:hypothetical protein